MILHLSPPLRGVGNYQDIKIFKIKNQFKTMEQMTFNYNGKAVSLRVYGYEREEYRRAAERINGVSNVKIG